MATIKAIETEYAGYRFRSRLEARWAIFFDHLGLPWQYEVEGYQTSAGWYLPDFRASPAILGEGIGELFFEIKGAELRQDEAERIVALIRDEPERRIFVSPLGNIPDPRDACPSSHRMIWAWGSVPPDRHCLEFCGDPGWRAGSVSIHGKGGKWQSSGFCGNPFVGPIEAARMNFGFTRSSWLTQDYCSCDSPGGDPWNFVTAQRTKCAKALESPVGRALTAARSARFEHGETPARP